MPTRFLNPLSLPSLSFPAIITAKSHALLPANLPLLFFFFFLFSPNVFCFLLFFLSLLSSRAPVCVSVGVYTSSPSAAYPLPYDSGLGLVGFDRFSLSPCSVFCASCMREEGGGGGWPGWAGWLAGCRCATLPPSKAMYMSPLLFQ